MQLIWHNWEIIVGALLFVLAFYKGTDTYRYIRFVRRLAEVAWSFADQEGILKNIKGADKAAPFLAKFFELWDQRFGELPPPQAQGIAMRVAAEESARHKVAQLASPKLSPSSG